MAIKNSVSNKFLSKFVDSINVFDCRLFGVIKVKSFVIHIILRSPYCETYRIVA